MTVEDIMLAGLRRRFRRRSRGGGGHQGESLYVAQIPKSGREPQDVLDYLGLGAKAIVAAV